MSVLFRLILGHLIGDFVLQTIGLVHYKAHSWKGLLIHSGIVTASFAVCLWNDLPAWWPWLFPLLVLHYLTDWGKVALGHRVRGWKLGLFVLDQVAHVAVIVGVVLLGYRGWPYPDVAAAIGMGEANRFLLFGLAWLLAFFVVPLLEVQTVYTFLRVPPPNSQPCAQDPTCSNGAAASLPDRLWGGLERTIVLALLYVGLYLWWPAVCFTPLAFLPRIFSLRPAWGRPNLAPVYRIKVLTSMVCAAALGILIWAVRL